MTTNRKNKKVLAGALAAALLISGTYAWQAFDQVVINESAGVDGNVGVRLHNDFDGDNADVYVENFASEEGTVTFTRVRLHEYMEIGNGAGYLAADEGDLAEVKNVEVLKGYEGTGSTVTIEDPNTWDIYLYEGSAAAEDSISQYVTMTHGDLEAANNGSKAYMPTFNRDFDDKTPDVNGSLLGSTSNRYDGVSYDDYKSYTVGETVLGDTTYNIFSDEAVDNSNVNVIEETHTAKYTETATIMSMAEWIEKGNPIGNYWVFDTDGWAYWANGLYPQTATGLLVDAVSLVKTPDADFHYGLHVVAESFTAYDWGVKGGDATELGVYAEGITTNGEALLEAVAYNVQNPPYVIDSVAIETPISTEVASDETLLLTVTVTTEQSESDAKDVVWTVVEKGITPVSDEDNTLNKTVVDGLFTPTSEMGGYTYTITATSVHDESKTDSVDIDVVVPGN